MYVLFEGIDTVGKSTQIERIRLKHPEGIFTHEPGGTPFGEKAREVLLGGNLQSPRAEMLLFLADRAEHYDTVIAPNRDKLIVSDRGFLSGIGYALAAGDTGLEELIVLNQFALRGDWPDEIVFFQTDASTLEARLRAKTHDGIEQRGIAYLLEVQQHMLAVLKQMHIPYLVVDATRKPEAVHASIVSYLGL
jgi:dTMP kinase